MSLILHPLFHASYFLFSMFLKYVIGIILILTAILILLSFLYFHFDYITNTSVFRAGIQGLVFT